MAGIFTCMVRHLTVQQHDTGAPRGRERHPDRRDTPRSLSSATVRDCLSNAISKADARNRIDAIRNCRNAAGSEQ
jgi:hypothetical protein